MTESEVLKQPELKQENKGSKKTGGKAGDSRKVQALALIKSGADIIVDPTTGVSTKKCNLIYVFMRTLFVVAPLNGKHTDFEGFVDTVSTVSHICFRFLFEKKLTMRGPPCVQLSDVVEVILTSYGKRPAALLSKPNSAVGLCHLEGKSSSEVAKALLLACGATESPDVAEEMVASYSITDAVLEPRSKCLTSILEAPSQDVMRDVKVFVESDFTRANARRHCMRTLYDRCSAALEDNAIAQQIEFLNLIYTATVPATIVNCIGFWTTVLQIDGSLPQDAVDHGITMDNLQHVAAVRPRCTFLMFRRMDTMAGDTFDTEAWRKLGIPAWACQAGDIDAGAIAPFGVLDSLLRTQESFTETWTGLLSCSSLQDASTFAIHKFTDAKGKLEADVAKLAPPKPEARRTASAASAASGGAEASGLPPATPLHERCVPPDGLLRKYITLQQIYTFSTSQDSTPSFTLSSAALDRIAPQLQVLLDDFFIDGMVPGAQFKAIGAEAFAKLRVPVDCANDKKIKLTIMAPMPKEPFAFAGKVLKYGMDDRSLGPIATIGGQNFWFKYAGAGKGLATEVVSPAHLMLENRMNTNESATLKFEFYEFQLWHNSAGKVFTALPKGPRAKGTPQKRELAPQESDPYHSSQEQAKRRKGAGGGVSTSSSPSAVPSDLVAFIMKVPYLAATGTALAVKDADTPIVLGVSKDEGTAMQYKSWTKIAGATTATESSAETTFRSICEQMNMAPPQIENKKQRGPKSKKKVADKDIAHLLG